MVKVNNKFSIPYGAGTSRDNKTVYIDHRLPKELVVNGKKMSVVKALVAHETSEKKAMDSGMTYHKAHTTVAIPSENKEVRSQGVDPKQYNKELNKYLDKFDDKKDKIDRPEPPDLEPKPYKNSKELSLLKKIVHKHDKTS